MGIRVSPTAAFWAAAAVARNSRANGKAARRSLLVLATLAQRTDRLGTQAGALLRVFHPLDPLSRL